MDPLPFDLPSPTWHPRAGLYVIGMQHLDAGPHERISRVGCQQARGIKAGLPQRVSIGPIRKPQAFQPLAQLSHISKVCRSRAGGR